MILKAGNRVTGRRRYPAGVRDTYPVPRRGSREYPRPDGYPIGAASTLEARAVRCQQCWVPIEDSAVLLNCWNCGSDNFLGHTY
jgi:hypothetical protein